MPVARRWRTVVVALAGVVVVVVVLALPVVGDLARADPLRKTTDPTHQPTNPAIGVSLPWRPGIGSGPDRRIKVGGKRVPQALRELGSAAGRQLKHQLGMSVEV